MSRGVSVHDNDRLRRSCGDTRRAGDTASSAVASGVVAVESNDATRLAGGVIGHEFWRFRRGVGESVVVESDNELCVVESDEAESNSSNTRLEYSKSSIMR